ncbi:MAG: hypothetical protein R2882_06675 [Gemmatimonadales bacterium]
MTLLFGLKNAGRLAGPVPWAIASFGPKRMRICAPPGPLSRFGRVRRIRIRVPMPGVLK